MTKRRSRLSEATRPIRVAIRDVARYPQQLGILALASLGLAWLILTKTLPYALAATAPETALWLSPEHPAALVVIAERHRTRLLELANLQQSDTNPAAASAAPPRTTAGTPADVAAERQSLQRDIAALARRILASDPLNAAAYRMLGEVSDDTDRVRALMLLALKHSRRETVAAFWLLNDSFERQDFVAALDYADILLQTRANLGVYVFGYMTRMAEHPQGRDMLLARLVTKPNWRTSFLGTLPSSVRDVRTPLNVLVGLKERGKPPTNEELRPYLDFLLANRLELQAYNTWLQMLSAEQLADIEFVRNASFERDPTGLPFDWRVSTPQNAIVAFSPLKDKPGQRALHISFGTGRVRFPEISQVLILAPGRYRLTGNVRTAITAKRGLRWQITCLRGARTLLGSTEQILGTANDWTTFAVDLTVPAQQDCTGQKLNLMHDARSASEQLISGEVWFDALKLVAPDN